MMIPNAKKSSLLPKNKLAWSKLLYFIMYIFIYNCYVIFFNLIISKTP